MKGLTQIKVAALAVCLSASTVIATVTASFSPTSSTSVLAGTPIGADISLSGSTLSSYDFAFILIGSEDPVAGLSFTYDPDWTAAFANVDPPDIDSGEHGGYTHDVLIMSDNNNNAITLSSIDMGNVVIDTTGMLPGVYEVRISNTTDDVSELVSIGEGQGLQDPIEGSMSFTVLPEPATALIMLIGGVTLLRRVKK